MCSQETRPTERHPVVPFRLEEREPLELFLREAMTLGVDRRHRRPGGVQPRRGINDVAAQQCRDSIFDNPGA